VDFDLRQLIKRIAWRRVALFIALILLIHFYLTHRLYLRMMFKKLALFFDFLTKPFYSIGDTFHGTNSEVFKLCVLAMLLITIIGIVKVLRQRQ